jgi:hypothetical protein
MPLCPASLDLRRGATMALGHNGETKMLYSEAAYFDGAHVAHIAAYYEHLRLQRIRATNRAAYERRNGGRR